MKKTLILLALLTMTSSVNTCAAVRTYYYSASTNVGTNVNDKTLQQLLRQYFNTYTQTVYKPTAQTTKPAAQTTTQANTQTASQNTAQKTDMTVANQILSIVNKERAAYGLPALTLDTQLCTAAQAKAEDMKAKNYFSHTSPTYGSPFEMMKKFGISYRAAGENIAKGQKTPQAVMSAWMNSDGHRKNILGKSYTQLGVGYVYNNGSPYWVQLFKG